jgi:hypothetical protein
MNAWRRIVAPILTAPQICSCHGQLKLYDYCIEGKEVELAEIHPLISYYRVDIVDFDGRNGLFQFHVWRFWR